MMKNIIFLDMDGPLLPSRQWFHPVNSGLRRRYGGEWFTNKSDMKAVAENIVLDPVAVEWFNIWQSCGSTAEVVYATAWMRWMEPAMLTALLQRNGMVVKLHEDSVTPKRMTSSRMNEIGGWMDDHTGYRAMIVDDDQDLVRYAKWFDPESDAQTGLPCDSWHKQTKLIQVNLANGIDTVNFGDACEWLGIDTELVGETVFGVKKLTDEQKAKYKADLEMLIRCAI